MPQYMLLIYDEEKGWDRLTEEQKAKGMEAYISYTASVRESGHFVAGDALHPTATATTLRKKEGKLLTTDGPFAETKEQLGGYYLIQAKDLDEALAIAARCPAVEFGGTVEVRPLMQYNG